MLRLVAIPDRRVQGPGIRHPREPGERSELDGVVAHAASGAVDQHMLAGGQVCVPYQCLPCRQCGKGETGRADVIRAGRSGGQAGSRRGDVFGGSAVAVGIEEPVDALPASEIR